MPHPDPIRTTVLPDHMVTVHVRSGLLPGRRWRRSVLVGMALALTGFGITAVAIAPLASEPVLPDPVVLSEVLLTEPVAPQVEALAARPLLFVRNDLTRSADTVNGLLQRLGVHDERAAAFVRSDASARRLFTGRAGKMVRAEVDGSGRLQRLVARYPAEPAGERLTHFSRLSIERSGDDWTARLESVEYERLPRIAGGVIRLSLFGATDEAGIPDAVAVQLAEIFSVEIDFRRELRKGDTFQVVYEVLSADGEPVAWSEGSGRVLAAQFVNDGRTYEAYWFDGGNGQPGYYGADGMSKRRTFLASPLEFSRVSSGFAMRFHPVLQRMRRHLGVDYAAPRGTPVRAVGKGVVEFAGRQNGFGNLVQIQHGNGRQTLYAHLSRIDVKRGQRIEQGERLGAVGATGLATGPHLHFEFRINGVHRDPMRVAKDAEATPLAAADRPRFAMLARSLQAQLDIAGTVAVAGGGTRAAFE